LWPRPSISIVVLLLMVLSSMAVQAPGGEVSGTKDVDRTENVLKETKGIPPGPNYNGSVLHVGPGQDYGTIQAALDDSEDLDVIVVHPATYSENVVVDNAVHISGMRGAIIEGGANTAILVNVDNVTISGMALKNASYGIGSYGSGLNVTNNIFYHNSYEINVQISNTTLTKDRICYPIVINGNTFDHISSNNLIDITLSLGSGRRPVDVKIGDIWVGNNNATSASTTPYHLRIGESLSNIWNGSISVAEATFLNNKLIGGGYGVYMTSTISNLKNTTFDLGGFDIERNNITNPRYRGISTYYSFDNQLGTTRGNVVDSSIEDNIVTSTSNTYNPVGIQTTPFQFTNSGEGSRIQAGNLSIERNRVSMRSYDLYIVMNPMGQTLSGSASFRFGDIAIRSNNMTSRASYGIYFTASASVFTNSTSMSLGKLLIEDNWISSSNYALYFPINGFGENVQGDSVFSMAGFRIYNNTITSSTNTGIYFYPQRMGKSVSGDSTFKMGPLNITKNRITAGQYGMRIRFSDSFTAGSGNARSSFDGFEARTNMIKSTSASAYIYLSNVASNLRDNAAVDIGRFTIDDNNMTGSEGVNIYISSFGNYLINTSKMSFSGIEVMMNKIVATNNGIYINQMTDVGTLLYGKSSVAIGDIRVQDNDITANAGINIGNLQNIAFNMVDDASCIIGDLSFDGNVIDAVNDGITLSSLMSAGRLLGDGASAYIGTLSFDDNAITSDHNGIRLGSLNNVVCELYNESSSFFEGVTMIGNDIASVDIGIMMNQMDSIGCYSSGTSKGGVFWIDIKDNTVKTTGPGIQIASINRFGFMNIDGSDVNIAAVSLIGNTVTSSGSIGIVLQSFTGIGTYNSGKVTVHCGGLAVNDNIVRSDSDGIFVNQIQAVGHGNSEMASVLVDRISFNGNDVNAAVTSVMIPGMQMFASGSTGDADVRIGAITVDGNTLRSSAPGIWIANMVGALSSDMSTSYSRIDMISFSDNVIESNMSGIRLDYIEIGANNNASSEIALGALQMNDNDITALGGGISFNMRIGQMFDDAVAKVGEVTVLGNSIEGSEGDGISIIFEIDLYNDSALSIEKVRVADNGVHGSNFSAIGMLMDIGVYNSSTLDMGLAQIIHNNITDSRVGVNLTGVKGATAYLNNFIDNKDDLALNASTVTWISPQKVWYRHRMANFTNFVGNYWDRYTGMDVDDDGLGDTPYDTSYGSDMYPFTSNVDDHFPPWNDVTPPSVIITSPADGSYVNRTDFDVEWTGEDDILGILSFSFRLDEGSWIDKGLLTQHSLSGIAEGTHTVSVMVIDKAFNVNMTESTFMVDVTDPEISMVSPSDGQYLNSDSIVVEWSGEDDGSGIDRYIFSFDEGYIIQKELNTTHPMDNIDEGGHTIVISAFDRAGNQGILTVDFVVDTIFPMVSPVVPQEGAYYKTSDINASWSVSDMNAVNAWISLDDGGEIDVGEASGYQLTGLSDGDHTLTVSVADPSNNEASYSVSFTIDTQLPSATLSSPRAYVNTSDIPVAIVANGTGSPLGPIYVTIDGGARIFIDVVEVSGDDISFTLDGFSDGDHALSIEIVDLAGNKVVLTSLFIVDTVAPIVLEAQPTGNDVRTDEPIVVRFSEPMDMESVQIISGIEGAVSWEGNVLTFDPDTLLDAGREFIVSVRGTDLAGNHVRYAWPFTTAQTGTITGRILDTEGNPVIGALVKIDSGESAMTDSEGRFRIDAPQGKRTVTVTLGGDELARFEIDVIAGATAESGDRTVKLPSEKGEGFPWWALILVAMVLLLLLILVIAIVVIATRKRPQGDVWEE
jgi:nitrous oxidase accessory protein NosD